METNHSVTDNINNRECFVCGRALSSDEIGLYKKVFGRASKKYTCIYCCADKLNVTVRFLQQKIEEYKAMGCTLFKSAYEDSNE